MTGVTSLSTFVISGLLLNLVPGPDTMYVLGRVLSEGKRAGLAAGLGIGAGTLVHTCLAAVGVSALLAASAEAFSILKICGAAFLLFQATMLFRTVPQLSASAATTTVSASRNVFWQAMLTNVLNPKVALFFLAFLPQFVRPDASHRALVMAQLGMIFSLDGLLYMILLVLFAARISGPLQHNQRLAKLVRRSTAAFFAYLGLQLMLAKNPG